MPSSLLDQCLGPACLAGALFAPMAIGALNVPLALYNYRKAWPVLVLVALDYLIPLPKKPWAWYHDMVIKPLAEGFHRYFPAFKLCVDPEFKISKERRYLFCAHPHGIFGMYIAVVMEHLLTSGLRMMSFAAPILTQLPLARRHFGWMGITSADAGSMRRTMRATHPHNCFWSTPGGIEEAFCVPDPDEQIVVMKRKGFCKIALQCGTDLVPVYGFGNNQMFPVKSGRGSFLANLSKKLNVTAMVWTGRFGIPFSFIPVQHPQLVAVGAPIPVDQCAEPSQEQIDALHAKYCAAIRQLFDKHKTDSTLENTGFAQRQLLFENEKKSK